MLHGDCGMIAAKMVMPVCLGHQGGTQSDQCN